MKAAILTLPLWPIGTADACGCLLIVLLIVSALVAAGRHEPS